MRKLVLAALLIGGLSQATGCFIESGDDDDDDDDSASGFIDVSWNLTSGREDEEVATCPPDSTALVVSRPTAGQDFLDAFRCDAGGGTTDGLPPGDYTVFVRIEDEDGGVLYAESFSETATVTEGDLTDVTFPIAVDGGYFGLSWTIEGAAPNVDTCDALGAGGVGVIATLVGTASATDDRFDCDAGEGVTDKIVIGSHTVVVDLFNTEDPPASLGQSEAREVEIDHGNQFAEIGVFDIIPDE